MTWDATVPLHDHLPTEYVVDGVAINLALLSQIEQAAIQEDKARWHLAGQMLRTKSTIEIRRWLAQQHEVYADDMKARLNKKAGRNS